MTPPDVDVRAQITNIYKEKEQEKINKKKAKQQQKIPKEQQYSIITDSYSPPEPDTKTSPIDGVLCTLDSALSVLFVVAGGLLIGYGIVKIAGAISNTINEDSICQVPVEELVNT